VPHLSTCRFFLFYLMFPPPPRPPLFPYTTLFRSFLLLAGWGVHEPRARSYAELAVMGFGFGVVIAPLAASALDATRRREHGLVRSEEHTSELQSHLNLVCRLLLEKKKKTKQRHDK